MATATETKLQMRELELNALFDTITAINNNSSEEDLYRIYSFINHSNTTIEKLVLFVLDEKKTWNCQVSFGTKHDYDSLYLPESIIEIQEITDAQTLKNIPLFNEFGKILPIKHKNIILAYALVGTVKGEEEKLDLGFLTALSNIIIVAVENKKLARQEKKQTAFKRQMDIAKGVQTLLFPKKLPYQDNLKVAASYQPHHSVGGDYYDFIRIDEDKFLLCIADVSGKGIPAAILMSNFQAALRVLVHYTSNLKQIVEELNQLILKNSAGGSFITAFFAIYNSKTKSLTYVNAGHNPPFLFNHSGDMELLIAGSTILGGFEPLPFLNVATINGLSNFFLFCFTDGFTETYNEEGEEFGEDALAQYITERLDVEPEVLHHDLLKHLHTFKGENKYIDDITLLSCKVNRI